MKEIEEAIKNVLVDCGLEPFDDVELNLLSIKESLIEQRSALNSYEDAKVLLIEKMGIIEYTKTILPAVTDEELNYFIKINKRK